ncbi:MAG TPA: hypothetical protein VHT75_05615 [Acidimicrobiales bacterium]|jgi:hypothetical protein|nr:hypothetical protein [Acidimicrobiales bacterium]
MPATAPDSRDLLAALDEVVESLEHACAEGQRAAECARSLREQCGQGTSWRELLAGADEAPLVRQVAEVLRNLGEASGRLRRAEARALHAEGLTTESIARLFGVTRQRVSVLLSSSRRG